MGLRTRFGLAAACAALLGAGCAATSTAPPAETEGAVLRRRGPLVRLEAPPPKAPLPEGEAAPPVPPDARKVTLYPEGPFLYDPYLAAQRQSRSSVKVQTSIGDGSHLFIENAIGFQRSLVRWTRDDRPDAGTELQFEAGVFAEFDLEEKYDMNATDWRFGLPLVRREGDLAWKFHLSHLTSHLGDEYIERTGAKQEKYHLEEAAFGLSWDASEGSRVYGEAGLAVYASEPAQNGRVQGGWEWVGNKGASGLAPYVAVDVQARNEQDWTPNVTAAVGVAFNRTLRFGLEFYNGRNPQTQFLKERIRYVSLGLVFDY